jgi:hypothetical protein
VTRGKKLSVVNWDHFPKMPEYQAKVIEAYGFPKGGKDASKRFASGSLGFNLIGEKIHE